MMLCCTSAPPTTGMSRAPEKIGQVEGATKQTWGREAPVTARRRLGGSAEPTGRSRASSSADISIRSYVERIDTFELPGCVLDAGVRANPAFLLLRDGL